MTFKKLAELFAAAVIITNASALLPASAEDTILNSPDFESAAEDVASYDIPADMPDDSESNT